MYDYIQSRVVKTLQFIIVWSEVWRSATPCVTLTSLPRCGEHRTQSAAGATFTAIHLEDRTIKAGVEAATPGWVRRSGFRRVDAGAPRVSHPECARREVYCAGGNINTIGGRHLGCASRQMWRVAVLVAAPVTTYRMWWFTPAGVWIRRIQVHRRIGIHQSGPQRGYRLAPRRNNRPVGSR